MFIADEGYFYSIILKDTTDNVKKVLSSKESYYRSFTIPKKRGVRTIYSLEKESDLYCLQKRLSAKVFSKIPLPISTKGFVKGENYNNYLIKHINKKYYLRLDIESFFDSINEQHIKNELKEFIFNEEVMKCIIEICTFEKVLPQGAVTSPILSNIIFRRIDQRVIKYCQEFNVEYTRYADDMLFSSDRIDFSNKKFFFLMIKKILQENNFKCNYSKKRIEKDSITLSGYVLKKDLHLSRKKLSEINKIVYFFRKDKIFNNTKYEIDESIKIDDNLIINLNKLDIKKFKNKTEVINYLCGYRSFMISVIKANEKSSSSIKQMIKKVTYIEKIVNYIEK